MGRAVLLFSRSCNRSPSKHHSWSPCNSGRRTPPPHTFQWWYCNLNFSTNDRLLIFLLGLTAVQNHIVTTTIMGYRSEQYSVFSIHLLRIFCPSVRHFPGLSWIDPSPAGMLSCCCFWLDVVHHGVSGTEWSRSDSRLYMLTIAEIHGSCKT